MRSGNTYCHGAETKKHGKNVIRILFLLILITGVLVLRPVIHSYAVGVSPVATAVYGQGGSFTSNLSGATATSLSQPYGNTLDSSGNLYVADSANNRVLYYAAGSTTATRVYGQGGSFTANTANNGGISANSLNIQPTGVAVDSSGNLYIADTHNSRVLYYAAGSTTATRVYGQGGSFTTGTANNGGVSTTSLNQPFGIALDSSGNLYVADYSNNRVLYYAAGSTTATRVYGQGGSFTANTANNGGISATSLNGPLGMALDSSGNLYVADFGNSRVLYYAAGSTTATRVYGQGGSFTANTANNGGISATSLSSSINLCLDNSGNLYVADFGNSRVLYYPSGTTTATRVYGQKGSFTTNSSNNGGISATSLNAPAGVTIDSNGNLYVDEYNNNRVLKFQTSLSITTQPPASTAVNTSFTIAAQPIDVGSGGVWTDFTGSVSVAIKSGTGTAGATLSGTIPVSAVGGVATFSDLAIDTAGSGYILTISYPGVGSVNTNTFALATIGPAALTVYGQGSNFTVNTPNNGGISATSLNNVRYVALDSSGNLYVDDSSNNRVLYYAAGSTTATRVYGQGGSFVTNTANNGGISATSLNDPIGLVLDSSGNLYIADDGNNRVLYYAAGSTTATRVYGQAGSFTTNTANKGGISATSLDGPNGITLDSSGNLYVADYWNYRVLYYAAGSTTATRVYGQGGSFTTNTVNNGGISATSLNNPIDVTLDSSGNLYVSDASNNRILYYVAGSTTATRVYGQGGSFVTNTVNKGGISATSLNSPRGFDVDSSGNLYVTDASNNRMLYYAAGSTTATRVYGQGNSFSTNTANNSGINATSLSRPFSMSADSKGNLYVADSNNNRVLVFQTALSVTTQPPASTVVNTTFTVAAQLIDVGSGQIWTDFTGAVSVAIKSGTGTAGATLSGTIPVSAVSGVVTFSDLAIDTAGSGYILTMSYTGVGSANTNAFVLATVGPAAITVYGQGGNFTTNTTNNGGVSATSLNGPRNTVFDSSGNLYVADYSNNRVLYYPAGSTTATRVYGQGGSFTANTVNNGGVSATSLNLPLGLALDSSGNLYIADDGNSRVLYYPAGTTTATIVYGQAGSFTTNTANKGGISATSLYGPNGIALDSSGNLYVADFWNSRVLYYPAGTTTATQVYGQGGSFTSNSINNGGVSATSLNNPINVALTSSGNLYIADTGNNRVLYYPAGTTTATQVYGQGGSFTTSTANKGGISTTSLSGPGGLAQDSSGNLYVVDSFNHRMLYYPAGSTTATRVYGQGNSFSTNIANNSGVNNTSLFQPFTITSDSKGNLYVADYNNNRVLQFQTALSVTTQPPASTPATSSFTVASQLIDVGSGQLWTDFTGAVSVVIKAGTGTAGATLNGGATVVSAVSGLATFSNLTVRGGTGYILTMSSPGVGSATTNAFNSVAGTIIFTYLTSPTFTFTLTGSTGTITSQHTFKINDSTGSGFGWHVNITSTQFVSGTNTLPTTALTITGVTAACTAGQTCVVPVNGINTYPITVPAATTAPASVAYMSANGGTGTGDVTVTTTFSLSIPPGTPSGTYTSTLTETVVNTSSYYTIVNLSTGQVADDTGNSLADGGTIIQYPFGGTGSLNQEWQLIDVGGGYDRIMNLRSGKALDVSGSSLVDGAGIVQNGYTGITSQQWQVVSVGGSYFKIVNRNSGKVLSSPIGGGSNPLIQVTYTGATTQQWQFVPLP